LMILQACLCSVVLCIVWSVVMLLRRLAVKILLAVSRVMLAVQQWTVTGGLSVI